MKLILSSVVTLAVAMLLCAPSASSAAQRKSAGFNAADQQPTAFAKDDVKADKKDKPKKTKKNPNDGKDNDPDDGDAGKGNDDREKPNDGPAND